MVGLEIDEARAESLVAGACYVEDVPDEVLQAALEHGYRPDDIKGFDVAVIAVPIPPSGGVPDTSHIELRDHPNPHMERL